MQHSFERHFHVVRNGAMSPPPDQHPEMIERWITATPATLRRPLLIVRNDEETFGNLKPWGMLLARLLIAALLIQNGMAKINDFAATAAWMAGEGMPMARSLLVLASVIELGGGILLAIGYKARWTALAIFPFIIPTTLLFHGFWAAPPDQVAAQFIHFQKNLAVMAAMLFVVFNGAGRFSFDRE